MKIRFLTPTVHGVLDYAAALGLIVLPFILNLGATSPVALWLSVAGGIGLIGYSLATDYSFGLLRMLPFRAHIVLDLAAAAAFAVAPFLFGWSGLTMAYYLTMAGGVIAVVLVTGSEDVADESYAV